MIIPAQENREKNRSCTTKHRQPARGEEKSRFGLPLFSGGSALPPQEEEGDKIRIHEKVRKGFPSPRDMVY